MAIDQNGNENKSVKLTENVEASAQLQDELSVTPLSPQVDVVLPELAAADLPLDEVLNGSLNKASPDLVAAEEKSVRKILSTLEEDEEELSDIEMVDGSQVSPQMLAMNDTPVVEEQGGSASGGDTSTNATAETAESGTAATSASVAASGIPAVGIAGLIGLGAVALGSAGGGSAAAAVTEVTEINARLSAGEFTLTDDGNGGFNEVIFTAYSQDGTEIEGTVSLNADGSIKFEADSAITGPILLVVSDKNGDDPIAGTNYTNEATNAAVDMVGDLRIILPSASVGGDTVAITPLTELATRVMIGDAGGDGGSSSVSFAEVSVADISASNTLIAETFGLTDITKAAITLDDADFATSTDADAQAYGQVLAALSGAESSTGLSTNDLLNSFAGAISSEGVDQSVVDAMEAGADKIIADGNFASFDATALKAKLATLTGSVTNVEISAPAAASDYVTDTPAQTITATLENALNNTVLWGSVDGGNTWTDISDKASALVVSWDGVTLAEGANKIKLAVTDQYEADGVTAYTDFDAAFAATDGAKITTQTFTLDTTDPEFAADDNPAAVDVAENTLLAYNAIATDAGKITYSLGGSDAALFAMKGGRVVFQDKPNYESALDDGIDNVYNITITATDFAGNSAIHDVAITVTDVNEAPSLPSDAAANFAENTDSSTVVYDATATDPDSGDILIFSLSGADKALFDINSTTGEITFKASPDFETVKDSDGDNVYDLNVVVTDEDGLTDTQALAVTVTDVNEAPVVTSAESVDVDENTQAVGYVATASDVDAADTLFYSLEGADKDLFAIDVNTGEITFASSAGADFESKANADGDNAYDLTVKVTDAGGLSDTQAITVNVQDVNELYVADDSDTAVTLVTGQSVPESLASFFDDPEGDTLTIAVSGDEIPGLTLNSDGTVTGAPTTDGVYNVKITATDGNGGEETHDVAFTVVTAPLITAISSSSGVVADGESVSLTVTLTESVTVADGATPSLELSDGSETFTATYSSGSGTDTLTFTATANSSESNTITLQTINGLADVVGDVSGQPLTDAVGQSVTGLILDNQAPVLGDAQPLSVKENADVADVLFTATATDASAVTYSLTGADAALFDINSDGEVTLLAAKNFESPDDAGGDTVYNINVRATDEQNQSTEQALTITLTDVNEAPVVTSGETVSVAENAQAVGYTATSTDVDASDTRTYSLEGADKDLFAIDETTGVLTFVAAAGADFEAKGSAAKDNDYKLTVVVTDADGLTDSQDLTVTVTDVNESPVITDAGNEDSLTIDENSAAGTAVYTVTAADPESVGINYVLSGADEASFEVSANGEVTLASGVTVDAESSKTGYSLTLEARDTADAALKDTVDLAITVKNVNELSVASDAEDALPLVNGVDVNENLSQFFTDPEGDALTISVSGTIPGVTIADGVLTGAPTTDGTYTLSITATDGNDGSATREVDITVVTAPVISSPNLDDQSNIDVMTDIVLISSAAIVKNTAGTIKIVNDGGTGFHGESVVNNFTIDLSNADDAALVSISEDGTKITLNLQGGALDFNNEYHIEISEGAFLSEVGGVSSVAVTDAEAINFTTVAPAGNQQFVGFDSTQSYVMTADGTLTEGLKWLDAEPLYAGTGGSQDAPRDRDFASGDFGIAIADYGDTGIQTNDFYYNLQNFGAGDLIFIDDLGEGYDRLASVSQGSIIDDGSEPTTFAFGASGQASVGLSGGGLNVYLESTDVTFSSVDELQALLNTNDSSVFYG